MFVACSCIVVLRRRAFKVARIGDLNLKVWNTSFPNIGEGAGSNYPTFLREVISNNIGEGGSFFCVFEFVRPPNGRRSLYTNNTYTLTSSHEYFNFSWVFFQANMLKGLTREIAPRKSQQVT